jgi:carboxymethylenebutenolidase
MKRLFVCLLMVALVGIAGCVDMNETALQSENETVQITSGGEAYPAYVAAPSEEGRWPAVVLIHSINGLEPGYRVMADKLASDGFVVVAPEWQTFNRTPLDEVVMQLVSDSIAYLKTRDDVDPENIGLTGFCIGGRYTMLFLPQITELKSGVAWYGFPYSGGQNNQSMPADFIDQLNVPMLIIHGTHDQYSNISDIYRYATDLNASGKYFEMKVYQGQPHGFMIDDEGQLSDSFEAEDAYWQMATFFNRTLV